MSTNDYLIKLAFQDKRIKALEAELRSYKSSFVLMEKQIEELEAENKKLTKQLYKCNIAMLDIDDFYEGTFSREGLMIEYCPKCDKKWGKSLVSSPIKCTKCGHVWHSRGKDDGYSKST